MKLQNITLVSALVVSGVLVGGVFARAQAATWTTQNGSFTDSGGTLSGSNLSLATLDGAVGNSVSFNAIPGPSVTYVAAVLNYTSLNDNLFVKIQSNSGNGLFDTILFYDGNNKSSNPVAPSYTLTTPVASTLFTVVNNGNQTVTATVGATGESVTRTLTQTFLGTGVGIGFYGNGTANSFTAQSIQAVPEPSNVLGIVSLGILGTVSTVLKKGSKKK